MIDAPHPLDFFAKLRWLDGRPLLDTIEPYRRAIFEAVLYTFEGDRPQYNLAICGRAKKNWKTSDLILGALWRRKCGMTAAPILTASLPSLIHCSAVLR
jgi:hypothetical protein